MDKPKQMIVMRRDLKMRKGKIAAQAGHACVTAVLAALAREQRLGQVQADETGVVLTQDGQSATPLSEWFARGVAKVCVYVDSEEELLEIDRKAKAAGILSALICDSGLTEFHGQPTYTCLAFEPALPEKVDPITGELPLF
ncbi:MAG TPA: aminoacyl-tRNA hydrolase [Candidatus Agathobaculum intestinipullorum]|nr:aminoacyl-tRNA hydrolase [Candidatus Agathobaculum intestinipullorum]